MIKNKQNFSHVTWPANSNKRVLPPDDAESVHRILDYIDTFVSKRSAIFQKAADAKKPIDANVIRKEIRDYWYSNPNLIDQFLQSKESQNLTDDQKQILISWKTHIVGQFLCVKYYAKFAVFVPMSGEVKHYAVLGLTDDFDELVPQKPPYIAVTALLPYKDVIIWDGLVGRLDICFSKEMSDIFIKECQELKKAGKIIFKLS